MEKHNMTKEHVLMNKIRIWCGQHGFLCFRCNVGKVKTLDGKWFDTGLPTGFSDLLIMGKHGDIYFCEVKAPDGKQRPDQKHFQTLVEYRGFKYILAYKLEDVEVVLNGIL